MFCYLLSKAQADGKLYVDVVEPANPFTLFALPTLLLLLARPTPASKWEAYPSGPDKSYRYLQNMDGQILQSRRSLPWKDIGRAAEGGYLQDGGVLAQGAFRDLLGRGECTKQDLEHRA